MRIAVQAEVRRRGIGRGLLGEVERNARAGGIDLLGSAFGLAQDVLGFWLDAGYCTARVGYRIDPASGAHSAQLLKGLSDAGEKLVGEANRVFRRDLPWRLRYELRTLPAAQVGALLAGHPAGADLQPDEHDRETLRAFALGGRGYADARPALWRCVLAALGSGQAVDPLLVRQVLQASAAETPDRGLVRRLRSAAATLLARKEGG
jgi:tRNA(Met) cytidine acetyltransferase